MKRCSQTFGRGLVIWMSNEYDIKYLPLAKKDLNDIISYISDHLKANEAALDFLETLEVAVIRLRKFPFSCRVYQITKSMEDEYRILPVKNYAVFYVVEGDRVEIRRIVYAKMDLSNFIF